MQLISLNVGQPQIVETPRGPVLTAIFKEPVNGRRKIVEHNVEGDRQADLTVHGGPRKAVYAYAREHYDYWGQQLEVASLPFGMFGENLTIEGLTETNIHIGDVIQIGTVHLRVTQPRMPCAKLGIRFDRSDMVKRFWKSNRSGIYFAVEQAGELGSGDEVGILSEHPLKVSIADVVSLYKGETDDKDLFRRFMQAPISGSWKEDIRERWAVS